MLTRQYFACCRDGDVSSHFPPQKSLGGDYSYGITCDCLIREVIGAAFDRAVSHIGRHYEGDVIVPYEIDGNLDVRAKTLGEYVYYIGFELAKNAFLATYHQDVCNRKPVRVTISQNDELIVVRVRDNGIGILREDTLSDIWRYGSTTATVVKAADGTLHKHSIPAEYKRSPIAGLGCGLPLARKYSRFLGGNVKLMTVPHFGTDVYFTFRKDVT